MEDNSLTETTIILDSRATETASTTTMDNTTTTTTTKTIIKDIMITTIREEVTQTPTIMWEHPHPPQQLRRTHSGLEEAQPRRRPNKSLLALISECCIC